MAKDEAKRTLVEGLFAPWDEMAWERLCEQYPEQAERVRAAVAAGVEPDDVWQHAEHQLYSPRVAAWLAQATAHARRAAGANGQGEEAAG